jgi:hypothetical protein
VIGEDLANCTVVGITSPGASTPGGSVTFPASTAIAVPAVIDQVRYSRRVTLGAVIQDATAALFLLKDKLPAGVKPKRGDEVRLVLKDGTPQTMLAEYVSDFEMDGGLSHYEVFLRDLSMTASADIGKFLDGLKAHQEKVRAAALNAVDRFGAHVLGDAQQLTPVDTGFLKSSATEEPAIVIGEQVSKRIGFGADYAIFVHENLNAHHTQGEAKFLEKAIRNNLPKFGPFVEGGDQAGDRRLMPVAIDPNNLLHSLATFMAAATSPALQYAGTPRELFYNTAVEQDASPTLLACCRPYGGAGQGHDPLQRWSIQCRTKAKDAALAMARAQSLYATLLGADGVPLRMKVIDALTTADAADGHYTLVAVQPLQRPGLVAAEERGRFDAVFNFDLSVFRTP